MNGAGKDFISASQIRAARAILNWSQDELADATQLSIATIRKLELGYISPRHTTTQVIRQALEDAGLEFIEPDGVRRRPDEVMIYQGRDGYIKFFDSVYHTALEKGGDITSLYASEIPFGFLGLEEYQKSYMDRMTALKGRANVKNILTENKTPLWAATYVTYRILSKHYVDSVPFYVFDNKYAVFIFEADPSPKIIVIQSRIVADAFRHQFYSMWEKAVRLM
jgi:transcriptional regulator with XRE-family HTH domain